MSESYLGCQLPPLFPASAVTFHPPFRWSAYKSLHHSRCEQTADVDIKLGRQILQVFVSPPRLQLEGGGGCI